MGVQARRDRDSADPGRPSDVTTRYLSQLVASRDQDCRPRNCGLTTVYGQANLLRQACASPLNSGIDRRVDMHVVSHADDRAFVCYHPRGRLHAADPSSTTGSTPCAPPCSRRDRPSYRAGRRSEAALSIPLQVRRGIGVSEKGCGAVPVGSPRSAAAGARATAGTCRSRSCRARGESCQWDVRRRKSASTIFAGSAALPSPDRRSGRWSTAPPFGVTPASRVKGGDHVPAGPPRLLRCGSYRPPRPARSSSGESWRERDIVRKQ